MINEISIDNFKSLSGFSIKLAKFNCLIGLNGSGKSTILQAMDFLSCLVHGKMDQWLNERHWDRRDLGCKLTKKKNITFEMSVTIRYPHHGEKQAHLIWKGEFNRQKLYCSSESITHDGQVLLKTTDAKYTIDGASSLPVVFDYEGSILSVLKEKELPEFLQLFRNEVSSLHSLDLLSPHLLRQRARASGANLGLGGEKLSAFLSELNADKREKLEHYVCQYYPCFTHYQTSALRSGWKKLSVFERFGVQSIETEARHVNDGMLRILAILAQTLAGDAFLLFDEIEDGINPELIERLVEHLVNAPQQVLVTTHSPMILNYLEDETACKGVQLIYKNAQGLTRAQPFFKIPSMSKKLEVMGPGEVFVDTDLISLVDTLVAKPMMQ